jgi:PAS domain S-box-containing protein
MPLKTGLAGGSLSYFGSRSDGQLATLFLVLACAPLGIALFLRSRNGKPSAVRAAPKRKLRKIRDVLKVPLQRSLACWIARRWNRSSSGQREADDFEPPSHFIEKITDTLPSILFVYDRGEKRHIYVNRAVTAILGYSDIEIREMDSTVLPKLVHPEDRLRVAEHSSRLTSVADGEVLQVVYRLRHKNGSWRWFHGSETVFARDGAGQVKQTIGTATDITEHQKTQKELQLLSSRLLSLHEEERRKLAFDLHEGTAQNLFAATLILRELKAASEVRRNRLDELILECEALCNRSLQEVRASSYALYPPALQHLGLASTFRWYVDDFTKQTGIQVGLFFADNIDRLPLEMEIDLFRVLQEGLSNVARHSGSNTASVRVATESDEMLLQISDNGHGFPADKDSFQTGSAERRTGIGILEMRQRLRHFGGSLEISSTTKGSLLKARIPIPLASQTRTNLKLTIMYFRCALLTL